MKKLLRKWLRKFLNEPCKDRIIIKRGPMVMVDIPLWKLQMVAEHESYGRFHMYEDFNRVKVEFIRVKG